MSDAAEIAGEAGRNLGRILWRRRLVVLVGVGVGFGLATAYVARITPSFEGAALVRVSDRDASLDPRQGGAGQIRQGEEQDLEDQRRLIESRITAKRLVDRLGLQLLPEFNPVLRADGARASEGRRDLLIPEPLLDRLPQAWVDTFGIDSPDEQPTDQERAARLHDRIVEAVGARIRADLADPSTLSVKFVSEDVRLAASGANALAELYLDDRLASRQEARQRDRKRLEQEIARLTASIDATEKAIAQSGAPADASASQPSEQDLVGLAGELAFWRSERVKIEARLGQVRGPLESEGAVEEAAKLLDTARLGELQAREGELERELAELSGPNDEQDPQVLDLRAELVALNEQKRREVEQTVGQLEKEAEMIQSLETSIEAKLETLKEQLADGRAAAPLDTPERRVETDRELRQTYMDRLKQLEAAEMAQAPDAQIISRADVPVAPAYPRRSVVYPSALAGGLLLGILLALGLEAVERMRR